jgi:hypothetical protein
MKPEDLRIGALYELDSQQVGDEFENFNIYFEFEKVIQSPNEAIMSTGYQFRPLGGIMNGRKITQEEINQKLDFTVSEDHLFIFKKYENPINIIDDIYEE